MGHMLEKLRSSVRDKGVAGTASWAASSAVHRLARSLIEPRTVLMLEKNDLDRVPTIRSREGLSCRPAAAQDLDRFNRIFAVYPRKRGLFRRRLERGQTCLACFEDGEAVGYTWISFVPEEDRALGIVFAPDPGQSYGFDLYVLPEYRKEGVGYALLAGWIGYSRDRGKTSCVGYVAERNSPMLLTVRVVFGFKPRRVLRTLTLLGRHGFLLSSAPWQESRSNPGQGG